MSVPAFGQHLLVLLHTKLSLFTGFHCHVIISQGLLCRAKLSVCDEDHCVQFDEDQLPGFSWIGSA